MNNVINLREARKRRDRDAKSAKAEENRAKFGRTRAEKARDADESARTERQMDGQRLDSDDKTGE